VSAAHADAGPVFLAPLRIEARAARRGAGAAGVERIGMGPARATAARSRLDRALAPGRPVVVIGLAGALVPGIAAGDVVVASAVSSTTAAERVELPHGEAVAALLSAAGLTVHHRAIVSSPSIVRGEDARRHAASGGAAAVDMESYWCEPLARRRPFVVVRVVIDVPGREFWSPWTVRAGSRAYRSMVSAARTLRRWAPVSVDGTAFLEVGDL